MNDRRLASGITTALTVAFALVIGGEGLADEGEERKGEVEAAAETSEGAFASVETPLRWEAAEREGAEYREIYVEAADAWNSGDPERTRTLLRPITDYCESKASSPGVRVVSVSTPSEFIAYTAMADAVVLEWVDMVCPASFKMLAFIDAHSRDFTQALDHLHKATELAPLWAEPHTEIGYIYNQLKEFEKAREAYEKALHLGKTYEASRYILPMALRGLGFTLIELGDLDAAENAFKESLVLEPGNELAKAELLYIEGLRSGSEN
jgi:tetratricopeptide (TPR) repeat protein